MNLLLDVLNEYIAGHDESLKLDEHLVAIQQLLIRQTKNVLPAILSGPNFPDFFLTICSTTPTLRLAARGLNWHGRSNPNEKRTDPAALRQVADQYIASAGREVCIGAAQHVYNMWRIHNDSVLETSLPLFRLNLPCVVSLPQWMRF